MVRSFRACRVLAVALGVMGAMAGKAFSATFTNTSAITIPAGGSVAGSTIAVSGLGNLITFTSGVSVQISDFTDSHVGDVDLVLVGPTGAALVLMGDAGGSSTPFNINLTFNDAASTLLSQTLVNTSGSFKPTQFGSIGSFPSPGPGAAYSSPATFGTTTLGSLFENTNPNGNWSLYAMDPASGDTGTISLGWSLQINAVPEPGSLALAAMGGVGLLWRRRRGVGR